MRDPDTAFLSARVPTPLRNRFKSLAARRGQKVQDLLQHVVSEFVEREEREPPIATDVIRRLRSHRDELESQGIRHLVLFGSVARGDARVDSDIDLAFETTEGRKMGLIEIGKLEERLHLILGGRQRVDLVPSQKMRGTVRAAAALDEIEVF